MLNWSIEQKRLELKYAWKISRNESVEKINLFIKITDGKFVGIGEVAPNIRYGESPESIQNDFWEFQKSIPGELLALADLEPYLKSCSNAFRFGVESAFIYYLCHKRGITISQFLGIPAPLPVPTSYTLPIMDISLVGTFIKEHNLNRFESLKLKVNQDNAADLTKELAKHTDRVICVDANESFTNPDAVINYLEAINGICIEFLEQPMPASAYEGYKYLKKQIKVPLIADESVTNNPNLVEITQQFDGINMKLMKAGGFQNGIKILQKAQELNLTTMIGCMVETSLGIQSAIFLTPFCKYYDLDSTFLLKKDPFNLISEQTGRLFFS
jgi:L-alanine-DL-glutamate epimerase-like enolase superfamily enzyme